MQARAVIGAADELGESVIWHAARRCVFWIDGLRPAIHQFEPETGILNTRRLEIQLPLGMIASTDHQSTLVLAQPAGVFLLSLDTGAMTPYAHPEAGREGVSYNDGKVDGQGRLWIGTFDLGETEPRGALWLISPDGTPTLADAGFPVVNGPAFSPAGDKMYVSDSVNKRILAYEVRTQAPWLGPRRVLARMTREEGLPDGLTVDSEGCVWCAHWDGGRVTRFSPQGDRLMVVSLPVRRVTSVAFGGALLDTLYITTARYGLEAEELARTPGAGDLYAVKPGVTGVAPVLLPVPKAHR